MKGKTNAKNRNCDTATIANVEQASGYPSYAAKENKGHDSPCRITIHSLRLRLADPDGISGKAAIDGLVQAGILQGDSAKYVQEVRFSQEKTKLREETRIIIEWDD